MFTARRFWHVVGSVWVCAFVTNIFFRYVLGEGRMPLLVLVVVAAVGLAIGFLSIGNVENPDSAERRDVVLGWTTAFALVPIVMALFVPLPWGPIACAALICLAALVLRQIARAMNPGEDRAATSAPPPDAD